MPGELTPYDGGLEPDEEYDGLVFADASFADTGLFSPGHRLRRSPCFAFAQLRG